VVYESVSGTNDMGDPLTMESPMFMNSVFKQFCAAATLMLRDQGKLSLDDTVIKYFPEFTKAENITLRHLLSMRSGLVRDFDAMYLNPESYADMSREELRTAMLEWLYDQALLFEPDTRMEYSNVNYTLLAYVVEQVSGMAYEDFIRQNIFEPLGMIHSGFFGEVPENPQWGLTYDNLVPGSELIEIGKGCGDIVSTASDMELWMTALQSGKVVCEESYREMTTSYSGTMAYQGYGYGLTLLPRGGWGHGGSNAASNNFAYFNQEHGYILFMATPSTPKFFPTQVHKLSVDFINILFKAVDAAAQQ
jgi:CubicO group peptidase (beta-lactamase class C family)